MSVRVDGEAALVSGGSSRVGGGEMQLRRNRLRLGLVLLVSLVGLLSVGVGSAGAATYNCTSGYFTVNASNVVTGNTSCAGAAVIPSGVTSIGASAFYNTTGLTSVTIPTSVISIGNYAFAEATSLTSIAIPASVATIGDRVFTLTSSVTSFAVDGANPNYKATDGVLFNKTGTALIQYPIGNTRTSYTTPSSVTTIGARAFQGAARLTDITIGGGVTSIGETQFYGATSLVRLFFEGAAAPTVGFPMFGMFGPPAGATAYRFASSTGFTTSGTPPKWNGLLVADYGLGATPSPPVAVAGVESATITVAAPSVGPTPTSYLVTASPNDASCTVDGGSGSCTITGLTAATTYTFTAVARTTSPATTSLASAASNGVTPTAAPVVTITPCTTGTFTITDNVVTSNTSCAGTVTIPNTVTSIASTAFQSATGLTTVTFEATSQVATIGNQAFLSASGLASITIPASVTTIGTGAFGGTSSLTSISVDGANPNYKDTDGVVFNRNGTTLVAYPSGNARTAYTTPSGVTSIYGEAFRFASRLTSVTIGSGVTTIGDNAFRGASRLTSVTIGSGVTTIGGAAFYNNGSLVRVDFEGLSAPTVGADQFYGAGAGATAYRFAGSTGFDTAGDPPKWNRLLVADYVAAPPAPVAVAGVESATITVATPALGPTPTSYLVTASSGDATCTVTGASGSCLITGLTAATTYTFTAVAKTASPDLTSLASAASNEVAPTAAPVVVPDTPVVVTTALADTTVSPAPVSSTVAPKETTTGLEFMFTVTQPGTIWLQLKSTSTRSTHRATPVICTTTKRITKAGKLTLNCPYTKAARQLLAKGALAVTSTTTFTPTVGTATTTTSALTLKRLRIATPRPIAKPTTPSSVTG